MAGLQRLLQTQCQLFRTGPPIPAAGVGGTVWRCRPAGRGACAWSRQRMPLVEEGSLYPALHRMEQQRWISSQWGVSQNNRRARFYQLTPAGRRQLEAEENNWRSVSRAVARVLAFESEKA